jgi:cytochrome c peroxidase
VETAPRKLETVIPRVQNPPPASDLNGLAGDLRTVPVPKPPNLGDFVKDERAAITLGKALFWDMQVGSDGQTACASCHFRAGADPRSKNQLSPGLNHVTEPDLSFKTGGVNHQLQASDFPLTRLLTPGVRGGLDTAADSNDVVSSQGVHWLAPGLDPQGFSLGFVKARRVAPRNTPSVINAVFNHRQFWDGRAENVFNGVNHLGTRDPGAKVFRADDPLHPIEVRVELINASLASQAVGPILSNLEMAEPGRTALDVARELARTTRKVARRVEKVRPLALQKVDPTDSVLGALSRWPQAGLDVPTYEHMIKAAFHGVWWDSKRLIQVAPDGTKRIIDQPDDDPATEEYSLLQYNFSLFFGLAIQMYESTLVSDDTPWDRFRRENPAATDPDLNPWTNTNPSHISRLALFGAHLFNERSHGPANVRCANCHELAEMTDASVRRINTLGPVRIREGNVMDRGFHNIGVRPTEEDLGAGASDAFGPLSYTKRRFSPAPPETFDGVPVTKGFGVEGAFKMPPLRNVALTAPYFHNGDARTLREVIELYSRGGNVAPIKQTDGTPIEPMSVPGLTADEIDAMVAWMEALTDERVLYRRAPFDHPQLFVPNGHAGDETSLTDANGDGFADDVMLEIPAVGAAGGAPIPGFLEGPFGPPGSP